jgi:hypothetical protein
MRSALVATIIKIWVRLKLVLDVFDLFLTDFSSANGTSLCFGNLVLYDPSELILFFKSWHEPIAVDTDEMESV